MRVNINIKNSPKVLECITILSEALRMKVWVGNFACVSGQLLGMIMIFHIRLTFCKTVQLSWG